MESGCFRYMDAVRAAAAESHSEGAMTGISQGEPPAQLPVQHPARHNTFY